MSRREYQQSEGDREVAVDATLEADLGVAEGAIGTLFQEFLLHRFTHGTPTAPPGP